jgi:hypothetical protein
VGKYEGAGEDESKDDCDILCKRWCRRWECGVREWRESRRKRKRRAGVAGRKVGALK